MGSNQIVVDKRKSDSAIDGFLAPIHIQLRRPVTTFNPL